MKTIIETILDMIFYLTVAVAGLGGMLVSLCASSGLEAIAGGALLILGVFSYPIIAMLQDIEKADRLSEKAAKKAQLLAMLDARREGMAMEQMYKNLKGA